MNDFLTSNLTTYIVYIPLGVFILCTIIFLIFNSDYVYLKLIRTSLDVTRDTVKCIEHLIIDPTKSNVLKAVHLYSVIPYQLREKLDKDNLDRKLLVHFLNLLNEENNNSIVTTKLTLENIDKYYKQYDNYLTLVNFVRSELDTLYDLHNGDKPKTDHIRNLDASFNTFMGFDLVPVGTPSIEGVLERGIRPIECTEIILKDLLELYSLRNELGLKYVTIGTYVGSGWQRTNFNVYSL